MTTEPTPEAMHDCWLLRLVDNFDRMDRYAGRLRTAIYVGMMTYIILHICGWLP